MIMYNRGLFPLLIVFTLVFGCGDNSEWEEFKLAHHCKIVQKKDSDAHVGFVVGSKGGFAPIFSFEDEKTAWLCDDGITYWR